MSEKKICSWCLRVINSNEDVCPLCGYNGKKKNPQGTLPLGAVISKRYQIGRYVGVDGEGATYLGYDKKEKIVIIVKEYLPATLVIPRMEEIKVLPKPGNEVLFKTTMYDFIEVYQNISKYENVPGIVRVNDVVNDNGTVYAVKEYVKGNTLVEHLNAVGYLDFGNAMSLLLPIFRTLEWMHEENLLHRGLSPENILVEKNGKVRLNGFATQALRTRGSELKGALYNGYSAPEQYDAAAFQDEYTDVYGIAAVLYTCITGEVPQNGQERKTTDTLTIEKEKGKISPRQTKILLKALSVNPQNRQQTIADFLAQLQGKEPEKNNKDFSAVLKSLTQKQKQAAMIGAGVLLVLLLFFIIIISGNKEPANIGSSSDISDSVSDISESGDDTLDSVPNFVGMTYQQIIENSLYRGQFTFVTEEIFSLNYRQGEIVEQTPAQGSAYTPGMTIVLKISKGEELVKVPEIVGMDATSAIAVLDNLNIQYEIMYVYDTRYPAGYVSGMDKQIGYELSIAREKLIIYVVRVQEASSVPSTPPSAPESSTVSSSEPSSSESSSP